MSRQNVALRYVILAIAAISALILFLPSAQVLLKFGSIAWSDMALALGLGAVLLVVLEGIKPLVRRSLAAAARTPPVRTAALA